MFGDILQKKAYLLEHSSKNKCDSNAFWKILRDIAVEDIKECYPDKVDSVNAVKIYYEILKENEQYIPPQFVEKMPSNGQEKYRVTNRNIWTSNAFNPDGLANQNGIIAERSLNSIRSGDRIIYTGVR